MRLRVVLGTQDHESFTITLNNNTFVHKWAKELGWCLANCEFNHKEAFSGFLTLEQSSQVLLQACRTINKYLKNFIEVRENLLEQDQEYFNYLHEKFEQLSGSFGKPTKLFAVANSELKGAIRDLNFFIHRVEKKFPTVPRIYFSFNKDQYRRQPLEDSDYQHFEFFIPAGTLVVHYVELGKDFNDLYNDSLPIDYKNTHNLHYYSGEASLWFEDLDCFQDPEYIRWLEQNGIDRFNKKLGHGKIVLGKVDNIDDAYAKIKQHQHIKNIIIED